MEVQKSQKNIIVKNVTIIRMEKKILKNIYKPQNIKNNIGQQIYNKKSIPMNLYVFVVKYTIIEHLF